MIKMLELNNVHDNFKLNSKKYNLYEILGYYLLSMYTLCNDNFYKEYVLLVL